MTIQEAHIVALRDLLDDLEDLPDLDSDPSCTSASYLRAFIGRAIDLAPTMTPDKIGRWVGFVQGVMAARGWLSVPEERDRTRELFTTARD